jgi:hypothetical protein
MAVSSNFEAYSGLPRVAGSKDWPGEEAKVGAATAEDVLLQTVEGGGPSLLDRFCDPLVNSR